MGPVTHQGDDPTTGVPPRAQGIALREGEERSGQASFLGDVPPGGDPHGDLRHDPSARKRGDDPKGDPDPVRGPGERCRPCGLAILLLGPRGDGPRGDDPRGGPQDDPRGIPVPAMGPKKGTLLGDPAPGSGLGVGDCLPVGDPQGDLRQDDPCEDPREGDPHGRGSSSTTIGTEGGLGVAGEIDPRTGDPQGLSTVVPVPHGAGGEGSAAVLQATSSSSTSNSSRAQ